jgi:hypothetical protein
LIPQLIDCGHAVTGTTRSSAKADALRALGATPAVLDAGAKETLGWTPSVPSWREGFAQLSSRS